MRKTLAVAVSTVVLLSGQTAQANEVLKWGDCPGGAGDVGIECASLKVPVDWQKPGGRQLTLVLGRLRSTAPKSEGSVLVNLGGPVGVSIDMMRKYGFGKAFADLRQRMDIVTWDLRGGPGIPGLSTSLPCTWKPTRLPKLPRNQREFNRLAVVNRAAAEECRAKDPELFANMDSGSSARDVEAIRHALGEPSVNFYGSSYGGIIAQAYARMYPRRVRTVVLDGTVNHSTNRWDRELAASARDTQRYFLKFVDWCRTDAACRLHDRDVPALWRRVVAKADRMPLPAGGGVEYDGDDVRTLALYLALDGPSSWPTLAEAIHLADRGNGSGFKPAQGSPYPSLPTPGVVECTDWPYPANQADLIRTVRRLEHAAPATGTSGTMLPNLLNCVGWPVPVNNHPAPLPAGLPPVLIAGAWREFESATRIAVQVPGSGAIRHDGPGHTLYSGNECARELIDSYLTDRKLPPNGSNC